MSWPTNFSGLAGGNEPLSLFDAMFAQVAAMVPIPCTATGTNSITLSPIGNAPSAANLGAYGSLNLFSFIAAATSTGVVSAQFGALASLPAFKSDGTTAVTTGDIAVGRPYMFMFSQALNSGGGGFYLLRPAVQPSGGQPTYTTLLSGSATYTTPANCLQLRIRMVGGGGGGSISGVASGSNGNTTTFGSTTALGGAAGSIGGPGGTGGTGGTTGTGTIIVRLQGGSGQPGGTNAVSATGNITFLSVGGGSPFASTGTGPAPVNTGAGGPGVGAVPNGSQSAGAGGAGEYVEFVINNPVATYTYTVGTAGAGGGAAQSGASGIIIVEERYQD